MKNIWIIARRDFRSLFTSPIAYIVIAVYLLNMGIMFFSNLQAFQQRSLQFSQYGGKGVSITEGIIQPMYGNMIVWLLFLLPFITMRIFAEEKKQHTIELLMTAPIRIWDMVLGKFASVFLFLLVMMAPTLLYPVALYATGNPDLGPIVANYVGLILLGGCLLSMGVLFSSMTENQIVAGALTIGASLFFWIVFWPAQMAGGFWSEFLGYVSIITHYSNSFSHGLITTTDVFYYVSFIFFSLFLTHRVLDSYRWR